MSAIEKLQGKYSAATGNNEKNHENTAPGGKKQVYGCGRCGSKQYILTKFNMWECRGCGALFPYLPALDDGQGRPVIDRKLKPCGVCGMPWLIRLDSGGHICPDCQPDLFPRSRWLTLVCAGKES